MRAVSPAELARRGYLQEANRLFFHPLGLAVMPVGDGLDLRVIDGRGDDDGFVFEGGADEKLAAAVAKEFKKRGERRQAALGFVTQPVGEYDPHPMPTRPLPPPMSVLRRRPFSRRVTPPREVAR